MKKAIFLILTTALLSGCSAFQPKWFDLTRNDLELVKMEYMKAREIVSASKAAIPAEDWNRLVNFDKQISILYQSAMVQIEKGESDKIRLSISAFINAFDMAQPIIATYLNDQRAGRLKAFSDVLRVWSAVQ